MFVQITTTIGCSNKCVFCPQDKIIPSYIKHSGRRNIRMDPEVFKVILSKLPKSMSIVFCGLSEPFQNPHCTDMILYAHRQGYQVEIYTTLIGLSLQHIQQILKEVPFNGDVCRFRIHLASEGNIEQIPVGDTYLAVLDYIIQSGANIKLHYHGTTLNKRIAKLLRAHDRSGEYWQPDNRARNLLLPWVITPKRKKGMIYCKCWGRVILPDGTVLLCPNDWAMKYKLGNILYDSYESIFQHKTLDYIARSFTDESIDSPCRYCQEAVEIVPTTPEKLHLMYTRVKQIMRATNKPLYHAARSVKRIVIPKRI